jgi:hypothetical protein
VGALNSVIIACIILHNMIIKDERQETENLEQKFITLHLHLSFQHLHMFLFNDAAFIPM